MTIFYAILVLASLGLLFGLVLAVASKVFYVEQDERLEPLTECLPGANCGGCGFTGCAAYAGAVLAGQAGIGKCAVGGSETAAKMAEILGVEAVEVARQVAFVRCADGASRRKGEYEGLHDCMAAMRAAGDGPSLCGYGCLGFGTCVSACQYDAIHIVDGRAVVDPERCTGCLACARACPRGVITAIPYGTAVTIPCASADKGAKTRAVCEIGCIGCRLCERTCQYSAVRVEGNLAVIDYDACVGCGACAEKCPRGLIVLAGGAAPAADGEPAEAPEPVTPDTP